jgi:hypothetical protein
MAESTLSVALTDLQQEVGFFLGYGRGTGGGGTAWDTPQTNAIASCVKSGLRQFYFPGPVPGVAEAGYEWSFLRPTATLALASGDSTVTLPDDFGGLEGEVYLVSTGSAAAWPVKQVNDGMLLNRYNLLPTTTGKPQMLAVRWTKGTGSTAGQRAEFYIWPKADADYTLTFDYYILPDALTTGAPYAYGSAVHAETILESCLAVAEARLDDAQTNHAERFRERLAASIVHDRRSKPQSLGYNRDLSDGRNGLSRRWLHEQSGVTVDGVQY